jgi:LacI family transcriptional regulator
MAITIADIANQAKVSISTVSRILNGKADNYRISKDTEKRVKEIAKNSGYRPNFLAKGLRLKRTKTIGLVIPDISNPFFAHVTRSIQISAHKLGYSLIVCNTDEDLDNELEHVDLLTSKGVDGYIIMPVGTSYSHLERLLMDNKPMVLLDRCFDELNTNSVLVDNYVGALQATEHLIGFGHESIAIIQGLPNTYTAKERLKGYMAALEKHHIPVEESLIVGKDFRKENGYIETKFLLNLHNPPSAIFTTSDLITLGALQAFFEEDIKIPDDISLVAFDDIDFAPFLVSPLTLVSQPKELMGEIAVKLLVDDIKNDGLKAKQRIVLTPRLVVRKSVAAVHSSALAVSPVHPI